MSSTRQRIFTCEGCGRKENVPVPNESWGTESPAGWWRVDGLRRGSGHVVADVCSPECAGKWLAEEAKKAGSTR